MDLRYYAVIDTKDGHQFVTKTMTYENEDEDVVTIQDALVTILVTLIPMNMQFHSFAIESHYNGTDTDFSNQVVLLPADEIKRVLVKPAD